LTWRGDIELAEDSPLDLAEAAALMGKLSSDGVVRSMGGRALHLEEPAPLIGGIGIVKLSSEGVVKSITE
jgi:hypothetical protein